MILPGKHDLGDETEVSSGFQINAYLPSVRDFFKRLFELRWRRVDAIFEGRFNSSVCFMKSEANIPDAESPESLLSHNKSGMQSGYDPARPPTTMKAKG